MTSHELITITTKRKIGKKKMDELWGNIVEILGDNLETSGGKTLTSSQFIGVWLEAHK